MGMAKLSDEDMRQLLGEFLLETREGLDAIEEDLVKLEQDPMDRSRLEGIFRTTHTIKGSAGFLGLKLLESIAHVSEDILTRAMEGQLILTSASVTVLLEALDAISTIVNTLQEEGNEGSTDYAHLKRRLRVINESCGKKTTLISTGRLPAKDDPLAGHGETWGLFDDEEPAAAAAPAAAPAIAPAPPPEASVPAAPAPAPAAATAESAPDENKDAPEAASKLGPTKVESTIRIDVNLLEKLMNLVGELVLARNQLLQYSEKMNDPQYLAIVHRASLVTSELQENVMKARMQPIGTVFAKFPRIVRDLAMASGKQIDLAISGEDTELDRTIHEGIRDPLVHLIRNACDHGVETPEKRAASGKPAKGTVHIAAYHEGGHVNIDISDDGAGVNIERVKAKGIEKGIISSSQAASMSDKEARELIMMPGFSTAEKITNVSGRGVGMDVVKTNVEKIGGTIEIDSEMGRGTVFRIKIPLTLAIIPALVVRAGGERFAIPQINLKELVRVEENDRARRLERVQGAEVMRLRGRLLPLARLNKLLRLEAKPAEEHVENVVVLNTGGRELGLIVDEVHDVEEIVVKPLSRQLKALHLFAGSTIMGDGRVALIVDVAGVAESAMTHVIGEELESPSDEAQARPVLTDADHESQTVLLLSIGQNDRYAIPLNLVSRLEEFPWTRVEKLHGRLVVQYRGHILPLVNPASHFTVDAIERDQDDTVNVVVFEVEGRSIGLLVNRIVDVVEARIDYGSPEAFKPGLAGSAIIDGQTTLLIDVFGLFKMDDADLLKRKAHNLKNAKDAGFKGHIVVVDDSQFFRSLLQGYLTGGGYKVTCFSHAKDALKELPGLAVDMITSDLDMPEMDGLTFTRELRKLPAFAQTPVIACTSRERAEYEDSTRRAGFTHFLQKLDHRELMALVGEVMQSLRQQKGTAQHV